MEKLRKRIHDDSNGLDYVLVGDYYIPALKMPEESRSIGRWGRMHQAYLDEQAQTRFEVIVRQMKAAEYVTEDLKCLDWLGWVQAMNSICNRAEEIIRSEMIYL